MRSDAGTAKRVPANTEVQIAENPDPDYKSEPRFCYVYSTYLYVTSHNLRGKYGAI